MKNKKQDHREEQSLSRPQSKKEKDTKSQPKAASPEDEIRGSDADIDRSGAPSIVIPKNVRQKKR